MKKLLLITIMALLILPSTKAYAYEEPIAGISQDLSQAEENPTELAIAYYSAIYDVDSDLVQAVINQESNGDSSASHINTNGSIDSGLMQINSCNHEWLRTKLGITDFYDPRQSIQCGCYILGMLSSKYSNVHRILMSYNMGEGGARKAWGKGIYSSHYSREVVGRYNKLKEDVK